MISGDGSPPPAMGDREPAAQADKKVREIAILRSIAEALNSSADVRQALEKTLALVAELLDITTAWAWLVDPDTGHFYLAAARDLPPYLQQPVHMTGGWCLCTDLFRQGRLAPTNVGMLQCSRLAEAYKANDPEATLGLRYHASIPLSFQDRPLGIINVTAPAERKLTRGELRLLATIAYQVGIAVERARLAEANTRLARAEERTRIAREIHDTLAQGLTAIGLDIEGALRHLDTSPGRSRERLERALATTRTSLGEARSAVLGLRSGMPGNGPLRESLAALARAFTSDSGVQAAISGGEGLGPLPAEVEAELYRIAQEALANVRKHAHATRVRISLARLAPDLVLSIHDDGVGFDVRGPHDDRYGLVGIRERVRALGGHVRITSREGTGTTVTVRVPAPPASAT